MALKPGMQAQLAETLDRLQDIVEDTSDEAQNLGRTARREIRSHPSAAVGIALGLGFIAGVLTVAACKR